MLSNIRNNYRAGIERSGLMPAGRLFAAKLAYIYISCFGYELEIKFTNGQTQRIPDYGDTETFGLQSVYRQLTELAKSLPRVN